MEDYQWTQFLIIINNNKLALSPSSTFFKSNRKESTMEIHQFKWIFMTSLWDLSPLFLFIFFISQWIIINMFISWNHVALSRFLLFFRQIIFLFFNHLSTWYIYTNTHKHVPLSFLWMFVFPPTYVLCFVCFLFG